MADSQTQVREAVRQLSTDLDLYVTKHGDVVTRATSVRTLLAAYTRMVSDMAEARKLMRPAMKAAAGYGVRVSDLYEMPGAHPLTLGDLRALAAFYNKGEE